MSILTRLAWLEATQAATVARFQRQPADYQRRVLDGCAARLCALGHLPKPTIPIATFRQQDPEGFRIWYRSIIYTEAWYAKHHAALVPAFFGALREEQSDAL